MAKQTNPFKNKKPTRQEVEAARKLARRVSPKLLALMDAVTVGNVVPAKSELK